MNSNILLFSNESNFLGIKLCGTGIYAHGKLEDILGYDILGIPYMEYNDKDGFILPFNEGVHHVIYIL